MYIFSNIFAEKVGFEPTIPLQVYYLSRVASSTTRAPLLKDLVENTNKGLQPLVMKKSCAESEGLEPPQACARRFSRPLQYHYASSPKNNNQQIYLNFIFCKTLFFYPKIEQFGLFRRKIIKVHQNIYTVCHSA